MSIHGAGLQQAIRDGFTNHAVSCPSPPFFRHFLSPRPIAGVLSRKRADRDGMSCWETVRKKEREGGNSLWDSNKSHHDSISDFGRNRFKTRQPKSLYQSLPRPSTTPRPNPGPPPRYRHRRRSCHHQILQSPSQARPDHTCHHRNSRAKVPKRSHFQTRAQHPLVL